MKNEVNIMAPDEKKLFWQQHIEGWQQSALSQKAYCRQHKLSFSSFGYWRTRLNETTPGKKLIPVTLSRSAGVVTIFLPAGIRMEVPMHALSEVLPIVCQSAQARF